EEGPLRGLPQHRYPDADAQREEVRMSCTFRGLTAGGGASPDQGKRAGGAVASTRVLKAHGAMGRVGAATPSTEHIVHARHNSTPRAARATADAGPRLRIHRDGAGRRRRP